MKNSEAKGSKGKAKSQKAGVICVHSGRSFASDPQQLERLELVSTDRPLNRIQMMQSERQPFGKRS